jgi:hypothetical protein
MGSPVNVDSFHLRAAFLDGGLTGEWAGWFSPRGACIDGPKATLLIALQIGLRLRRSWLVAHGLENVTKVELLRELQGEEGKGAGRCT